MYKMISKEVQHLMIGALLFMWVIYFGWIAWLCN